MTAQTISSTLPPSFNGLDGLPLTGGYVYIGQPGLDPRQYPETTFYDAAMTVPAAQPLRTSMGFLFRNGTPTNIWIPDGVYSLMVRDAQDRQVLYVASWTTQGSAVTIRDPVVDRFSGNGVQTAFPLSVTPGSENSTDVFVGGAYVQKDAYSLAGNMLTFAVAPALGTNNIEVNTETSPEYAAVVGSLAALVASASGFSTAASASAAAAAASYAAALGQADRAAAIAAAIGAGGSFLERSEPFTAATNSWTVVGTPFTAITKINVDGRGRRLSDFTLSNGGKTATANFALYNVNSLIDIYYI